MSEPSVPTINHHIKHPLFFLQPVPVPFQSCGLISPPTSSLDYAYSYSYPCGPVFKDGTVFPSPWTVISYWNVRPPCPTRLPPPRDPNWHCFRPQTSVLISSLESFLTVLGSHSLTFTYFPPFILTHPLISTLLHVLPVCSSPLSAGGHDWTPFLHLIPQSSLVFKPGRHWPMLPDFFPVFPLWYYSAQLIC